MRKYLLLLISSVSFAQQVAKADFRTINAAVSIDPTEKNVVGDVKYIFNVLSPIDTIRIDAINMVFTDVEINGRSVKSKTSAKALKLFEGFKKGKNTLTFHYEARPKQTMYFTGDGENRQIWTQGQGKYTSHWLPSFDDVNEKVVFNLEITATKSFTVISNGALKSVKMKGNLATWRFAMQKPMASYLAMVALGDFTSKTEKSKSGKDLTMYYLTTDEGKFAPTYKHSKAIFDFLEKEIGVGYPWENYKQVPVKDFLYAGMENTSATVFAQDFVVDDVGFHDKDYINVNAHELAHQWFGDMVTAKSGKDHWLQEGFATYYALLAEQSLFGDDHFNFQLYQMAEELQRAAVKDTIPILNEKASSLTFYRKGAWALHVLREGVGHENFREAVKNYLKKYAFSNVDTSELMSEINKVSTYDTNAFRQKWLEQGGFDVESAIAMLKRNAFMKEYFNLIGMAALPLSETKDAFEKILQSDAYFPMKEEVVFQTANVPFEEKESLLRMALQTSELKVRQAVAGTAGKIPMAFYPNYVVLLDDASYVTKGIVLKTLWEQFPEKQQELLDKTQTVVGFNDKNIRILWLTLALGTREYQNDNKLRFYDELLDYAGAKYESSVRQNALENLLFFNPNDVNVLALLVNPLVHHKWQFSSFAREKIREKLKKEIYRDYFTKLLSGLVESERVQLQRLLDEMQK